MSDSSSTSLAVQQHHEASSPAAIPFNSPFTVAFDSTSSSQHMHAAYDTQQMRTASPAPSSTRAEVSSAHPINGTAASSSLVTHEQSQPTSILLPAASADSVKSPALLPCTGESGFINASSATRTLNNSSATDIQPSIHMDELLTTSDSPRISTQINHPSNFIPHVVSSPQHLANSSVTVVAPVDSTHSTNRISANIQPIPTGRSIFNPSSTASASSLALGAHIVDDHKQQSKDKHTNIDSMLKDMLVRIRQFELLHPIASATAATSSGTPSVSTSVATIIIPDTACHCLIIDTARLRESDQPLYSMALNLGGRSQREDLLKSLRHWLQVASEQQYDASGLVAASISHEHKTQTLHLVFESYSALAAAMVKVQFLVRCGTTTVDPSQWNRRKLCGASKQNLPELIKLTFTPSQGFTSAQAKLDLEAKLVEHAIAFTSVWPSTSAGRPRDDRLPTGPLTLTFNILPRLIDEASLRNTIDKLGLVEIGGSKLRVHALNTPSLERCPQCDALGHSANKCPQYTGKAIRLLMKAPVSIVFANGLAKFLQASNVYVGSDFGELVSRRVTFLFPEEEADEEIVRRLEPVIQQLEREHKLHEAPASISVGMHSRRSECEECGSTKRPHECPFTKKTDFRVGGPNIGSVRAPGPGAAIRAAQSLVDSDGMCRSWHSMKKCPRHDAGQVCKFNHPPAHVPEGCFSFNRIGRCNKDMCPYPHHSRDAAPGVVASPHVPLRPAASIPAAAAPVAALPAAAAPSKYSQRHEIAPASAPSASAVRVAASNQPALAPVATAPSNQPASASAPAASPTKAAHKRGRPKVPPPVAEDAMVDDDTPPPASTEDLIDDEDQHASKKGRLLSSTSTSSTAIPTSRNRYELPEEQRDDEKEIQSPARSTSKPSASPAKPKAAGQTSSWGTLSSPSTSSTAPLTSTSSKKKAAIPKGGGDAAAAPPSSANRS